MADQGRWQSPFKCRMSVADPMGYPPSASNDPRHPMLGRTQDPRTMLSATDHRPEGCRVLGEREGGEKIRA